MHAADEQQHIMTLMMTTTLIPRRPWLAGSFAIESKNVPPRGGDLGGAGAGGGGSWNGTGASADCVSAWIAVPEEVS